MLDAGEGSALGGVVALLVGAAAAVALLLVLRRLLRRGRAGRRESGATARPTVPFYRRLEAILRRHGFRRGPAATPLEFVRAVVAARGDQFAPAEPVVLAFYRVRFGGEALSKAEMAQVARALAALEQQRRAPRIGRIFIKGPPNS